MLTGEVPNGTILCQVCFVWSFDLEYKQFHNYDVYEDGKVFSHFSNKFLKNEVDKHGYVVGVFFISGQRKKIKIHRLVASLFLGEQIDQTACVINHKDGNKENNHYSNLEWCTPYENNLHARVTGLNNVSLSNSKRWCDANFRKATSEAISKGHKEHQSSVGERNPRFRYRIYNSEGFVISRIELKNLIGLSQSRTDKLIKDFVNGIENPHFITHGIQIVDTKQ